ncbi:MAG: ATPase domain-containing protein, partial [Cystobacter sp.]
GVPRLDTLLKGGVPGHSSTLLAGAPGSGKTLLGLHFLAEGAARGEPGLYHGFGESRARLLAKAEGVGLALAPALDSGLLVMESRSSVEGLPDARAHELLRLMRHHHARRLVLDGLELMLDTMSPRRTLGFVTALLLALRSHGVTPVMIQRTPFVPGAQAEGAPQGLEALIDNIVFLRYVEQRSRQHRLLSVLKMSESGYETTSREFSLSSRGITVAATSKSAEDILQGRSRRRATQRPTRRESEPRRRATRKPGGRS